MSIINILPVILDGVQILLTSLVINILFLVHYGLETYYFFALRTEFITIMVVMLFMNAFWTLREFILFRVPKEIKNE
jgi:hypothetical protein